MHQDMRQRLSQWNQLRALGRMVAPTQFQIIAALLPIAVYIGFGQGAEVLSMLGEGFWSKDGMTIRPSLFFLLANGLAGMAIWWSARIMMEFQWKEDSVLTGWARVAGDALQRFWPRLLGITPVCIVAIAFFYRITKYQSPKDWRLLWSLGILGTAHLLLAFMLLAIFWTRRQRLRCKHQPESGRHYQSFREMAEASPGSARANATFLGISILALIILWASPLGAAKWIGTGAMLSLAAVAAITCGTILMSVRARTGAPLIVLAFAWLLLCSAVMDNHDVRLSPANVPLPEGLTASEAIAKWLNDLSPSTQVTPAGKSKRIEPVFIIATEGGGIRAAYWTAKVLCSLEEASPEPDGARDFAAHVFAISGVSGGSVGAAIFDALLVDRTEPAVKKASMSECAHEVLGQDHLAPLLGSLLFPDAFQRFIPWALPGTDRGTALERSWETAYREVTGSDRLAQPFRGLWSSSTKGSRVHVPHLFLNSTMVGTGQRVIFSDLAIKPGPPGGEFLDAVDARSVLFEKVDGGFESRDVPLSTAAHASARFTYTNPAGRLSTGQRIVDGGYFEDSGALTAMELVQVIDAYADSQKEGVQLIPVVIMISNEPVTLPEGSRKVFKSSEQQQLESKTENAWPLESAAKLAKKEIKAPIEFTATKPSNIASEILSPPHALMATRGARGTLARRAIYEHQMQSAEKLKQAGMQTPPTYIQFHLADWGIPLPLGWSLSKGAAGDMQAQFVERREVERTNPDAMEQVMAWIGGVAAPNVQR